MAEALNNAVWDEMRAARNLAVVRTDVNRDGEATFRVTFDIVLNRESYETLIGIANHRRRGLAVQFLKRIVARGFKLFFSDEENETAVAASRTRPPTCLSCPRF
jgi:hypothetical protein